MKRIAVTMCGVQMMIESHLHTDSTGRKTVRAESGLVLLDDPQAVAEAI